MKMTNGRVFKVTPKQKLQEKFHNSETI